MNKEEFLKIQTCVLKVNIHCDGCKQEVKKILHKIDGVYKTNIDGDQGKVTVSGNVDPAILIKKLAKSGKHAELWATKGGNNNQPQKLPLESGKGGQKDNGKPQKGGGGGGGGGGGNNQKGQQQAPPQQQILPQELKQQQMKGFKDLKLPQLKDLKIPFTKDQKSVKFDLPEDDDGSDYDDSDEYDDDEDFDDLEGFDDDSEDDLKNIKEKPMNGPPNGNGMMNEKKGGGGGGNAKKGGGDVNGQSKGGNEVKNGNGGKKGGDGNLNKGSSGGGPAGKNGGGGGKNGGGEPQAQGGKNGGNNKAAPATNGGNEGKKSEAGGNPTTHPVIMGQGFPGVDPGQMGHVNMSMGQMGSIPAAAAVQGLPAGGPPPGHFQVGPMAPEMMAAATPYQQQYVAAMMQQQRMMMNGQDRSFQPMAYARPPPSVSYMPPPPEYTNFFSDENTSSCSIM